MNHKNIKKYITDSRTPFFEVVNKYIDVNSIILDVGSGDGQFAKTIMRNDVYMLDGNRESVGKLKKEFMNCQYGQADKLPYSDECFDMIHSSHVVEHLMPQQLYDFLKEADRCLKPNGYLVISAPLLWSEFYDDLSHMKPYNPKLFEKYLCWGLQWCCTRPLISSRYLMVEKIYRLNTLPYDDGGVFVFSESINKILMFYKMLKYNLGFRKLEKSGFTIVLRKQQN